MWTSEGEKSNLRCKCLFRKGTIQLNSASYGLTMKCPSQDRVWILDVWLLTLFWKILETLKGKDFSGGNRSLGLGPSEMLVLGPFLCPNPCFSASCPLCYKLLCSPWLRWTDTYKSITRQKQPLLPYVGHVVTAMEEVTRTVLVWMCCYAT